MAVKIAPSLRSALERLKHAGAVNGICLAWRRQVLINLLPYEDFRADKLMHALHDAHEHFAGGGHEVQTFWFGFEGVHLLALRRGDCSLIVLHARAFEADFIAGAAVVAWLAEKYYDRPVRRWINGLLAPKPAPPSEAR